MKYLRDRIQRVSLLLATLAILVSPLSVILLPLLESPAQAQATSNPSGFNTHQKMVYSSDSGSVNGVPEGLPSAFQTCKAVFGSRVMTGTLINQVKRPIFDSPEADINTSYIESRIGQSLPVIEWVAATPSEMPDSRIINGGYRGGGGNICSSISPMVQTATNVWRGTQLYAGAYVYMTFTRGSGGGDNTTGTFQYHDTTGSCFFTDNFNNNGQTTGQWRNSCGRQSASFVVEGKPSGSGSGSLAILGLNARWIDAASIALERPIAGAPSQAVTNEVYRMVSWRAYSVGDQNEEWSLYFLAETAGARSDQVWSTGRGCENPIRNTGSGMHPSGDCQALNGANFNCVPFIAVHRNINLSRPGGSGSNINVDGSAATSFASRVNGLGNADAFRFDYTSDCSYMGNSGPGGKKIASAENARIWFYQSENRENVATVFPAGAGAGNEAPYTGTYTRLSTESQTGAPDVNVYEGGASGCNGRARVVQQSSSPGSRLPTNWALFPENCQGAQDYGSVSVFTLSGEAGAENFNRISSAPPPATEIPGGEAERIGCSYEFYNPLTWLICPVIDISRTMIEWFDSGINSMLTINSFSSGEEGLGEGTVDAFRDAWSVIRTLALALIVIAALIMVIAQAAGIEILDAYTIRKVLPRLLLAAIGITVSWQLAMLAITISNDLGEGIRAIIYAPFGDSIDATVGQGTTFILGLLTGGAIIAFGLLALLSFVVTGVIAVLVAFGLLAFREIAIIALTIVMPIAIACSILPNTQKFWDLWRKTYLMLLAAFVIIMAFIAVGRVFAAVTVTAGAGSGGFTGAFMQIIGIIAYFAPYFMIPFVFKMAGGMMAAVGGVASRGFSFMAAPVAGFRKERGKSHRQETMAGNNWLGRAGGGAVGGAVRRVSMADKGGLSLTPRGRARYQSAQKAFMLAKADEAIKQDNGRAAGNTDANEIAIDASSGSEFLQRYAQKLIDGGSDAATAQQKARDALGTFESGYGLKMGTAAAKLTAWKALAADNTAYAGYKATDTPEERLEKYRANMAKMYSHGASLINAGIIDAADAAGISKSNKMRGDFASIGYGTSIATFDDIARQQRQHPDVSGQALFAGTAEEARLRGGKTIDQLMEEAVLGTNASTMVHGRHEQISAFAPVVHKKLREAASNAFAAANSRTAAEGRVRAATTDAEKAAAKAQFEEISKAEAAARRQVAKYAALAANVGDAVSQGHMVTGEKVADMFAEEIPELGGGTLQQVIAAYRSNPDFQKYRREYSSPFEDPSVRGASQPAGGTGPAPTPPAGTPTGGG